MRRRRPEPPAPVWIDDEHFRVDDVAFACSFEGSTRERFSIRKPRDLVDDTVALLRDFRPRRIVELGIAGGGSVALIALVARPERFVAFELRDRRVPTLDRLIEHRALSESVRPFYGIDQGDRERLLSIAEAEFAGAPLDLVIDDASHRLELTRASFECLFPLLRPGGRYVIEDWNWQLKLAMAYERSKLEGGRDEGPAAPAAKPGMQGVRPGSVRGFLGEEVPRPLELLVLELVLARACSGDAIAELAVGPQWTVVTRGPAALDPRTFRIADTYVDTQRIIAT